MVIIGKGVGLFLSNSMALFDRLKGKDAGTGAVGNEIEDPVTELRKELARLKKELRIRVELARVVAAYRSPDDLLPNVLNVLCDGLGANGGAIYFMEKDTKEITLRATYGLDRAYAMKYQKIHLGEHVTGVVAETGEGMIIKDASQDNRSTKGVVEILKYRSAVVTPVTSEGEVVGIIALINENPNFFTQNDLKLLEFMGANISLAIVNSFLNQEISLERERLFDILEQVDEGIFQVELDEPIEISDDMEGSTISFYHNSYFTLANPSFRRQCGFEVENGSPMHKGFEDIQLFRMLKEVISKGSVMGVERRWDREEEKLYEVSMVIISKDDRIKGVKGVRRDMTSRMKMEEKLQESKAQTELYMDVLSHDIANINTAIMGFMEIMENRMGDTHQLIRYVRDTRSAIERSTQLIKKVKGLSKIQRSEPELSMADLIERTESNFERVKSEYPHRTLRMNLERSPGPALIRCDEMIDDLISNLFRNSISSMDTPTVEMEINIKPWSYGEKHGFLLSIMDNGRGIPDEMKERVLHGSRSECESTSGKGLGLFLVKGIAERFGGKIWIEDRKKGEMKIGSLLMVFFPSE